MCTTIYLGADGELSRYCCGQLNWTNVVQIILRDIHKLKQMDFHFRVLINIEQNIAIEYNEVEFCDNKP